MSPHVLARRPFQIAALACAHLREIENVAAIGGQRVRRGSALRAHHIEKGFHQGPILQRALRLLHFGVPEGAPAITSATGRNSTASSASSYAASRIPAVCSARTRCTTTSGARSRAPCVPSAVATESATSPREPASEARAMRCISAGGGRRPGAVWETSGSTDRCASTGSERGVIASKRPRTRVARDITACGGLGRGGGGGGVGTGSGG